MAEHSFTRQSDNEQNRIQGFAFLISAAICVLAFAFFAFSYFSRFDEHSGIVLEDGINPNEASVASLVRLPGVGRARAEAIVAYRENFAGADRPLVFTNCRDLQKVKGIGPKTAEGACQWLKFANE